MSDKRFRKELNKVMKSSRKQLSKLVDDTIVNHHPFCRKEHQERRSLGLDWRCSCDFLRRYDEYRVSPNHSTTFSAPSGNSVAVYTWSIPNYYPKEKKHLITIRKFIRIKKDRKSKRRLRRRNYQTNANV